MPRMTIRVILMIAVITAGLLILILARPTSPKLEPAPLTLDRIRELATLVNLEITFEQLVESKVNGYLGGNVVALAVRGRAWLGTDLDQAKIQVNDRRQTAVLTLREPQVMAVEIDQDRTTLLMTGRSGLWRIAIGEAHESRMVLDALREAQQQMRQAAQAPHHRQQARDHAEQVLQELADRSGYRLTIRWAAPEPADMLKEIP